MFLVFNDTATTEIYTYGHTLSLPDALPISVEVALRIDANHHALHAERVGQLADQGRPLERGRVDRHLVGAGLQHAPCRCHVADTAGNAERDVDRARHTLDPGRIDAAPVRAGTDVRSEEPTSELQSLMRNSYAVFCLQKKKSTNVII